MGLTQTGLRSAAADEERTAITLTLPEVYMDPQGGDQQLPLLVTGFVQVGAVSLRINFSGQVVEYRDVVSKVPGVTFTRNLVGEEIRVEWYDGSGGAHPISIGTDTLLAVVFRPQGQPGATSPVMFGQECMLGDAQGNPISGVQYSDGSVTLGNPAEVPEHGGPAAIFDFRVAGTGMRPEAIEFLYSIPKAAEVSIRLDDVAGRQIGAFVCSDATPGRYRVRLADVAGTPLPGSGVYFARFQAGPYQRTAKFVTLR